MSLMSHVPDGTVQEILEWVDDDPAKARAALDVENGDEAPRTTLINKLEAIAMTDETTYQNDETDEAPGPEQPTDVTLDLGDPGTVIGPLHTRDTETDVPKDADLSQGGRDQFYRRFDPNERFKDDTDRDDGTLESEQVDYFQTVGGTNGLILVLNGTAYGFTKEMTSSLHQAVNQGIVGMTL